MCLSSSFNGEDDAADVNGEYRMENEELVGAAAAAAAAAIQRGT